MAGLGGYRPDPAVTLAGSPRIEHGGTNASRSPRAAWPRRSELDRYAPGLFRSLPGQTDRRAPRRPKGGDAPGRFQGRSQPTSPLVAAVRVPIGMMREWP